MTFECSMCEGPFEDHPLAMAPHVCDGCGGDLPDSEDDCGPWADEEMGDAETEH